MHTQASDYVENCSYNIKKDHVKIYINATGYYVPSGRVPNEYFFDVNGLTSDWIYQRTGILSRSKAGVGENTNTMAAAAVGQMLPSLPYDVKEFDLIVGASYAPFDTVYTLAHNVQRTYSISNAQVLYLSSACSSFVNALEVVQGYFAMGKAQKALIVAADHNTFYGNEEDPKAGHLWGDGAVAVALSKERVNDNDSELIDVYTRGLACLGKADVAVSLRPKNLGISMPEGKDVFIHACKYMKEALLLVLERNGLTTADLNYMAGHQANMRILAHVAQELGLDAASLLVNIEQLGNTGCSSNMIAISQNWSKFKKGDLIGGTVFGGGYSCGSYLIRF